MKKYPLHHNDTQPLYTTLDTEYVKYLHECKMIVESMSRGVVSVKHMRMIVDAVINAKSKHPKFADVMTLCEDPKTMSLKVNRIKHINDNAVKNGMTIPAEDILAEEVLEALEQYLLGNKKECAAELADTAAVVIRMMEMNEQGEEK